jgi:hypothetical protein
MRFLRTSLVEPNLSLLGQDVNDRDGSSILYVYDRDVLFSSYHPNAVYNHRGTIVSRENSKEQ